MERYEIIIQDRTTKKPTNVAGEDGKKKKSNVAGEKDENKQEQQDKGIGTAKVVAKNIVNEARLLIVPHIADISRDSLLQQKVDATLNMLDTAVSFYVNPVYGAINLANKMASTSIQYIFQLQKEQNRLSVELRRAGYINRSRD